MFKFELGLMVRDKFTFFTGTITARVQYISGDINYRVESIANDDNETTSKWIGEERLEEA